MFLHRLISGISFILLGGFTTAWLAIMISTAIIVALPILSFALTLGAGLVVYSVRNAVHRRRIPEDSRLII